MPFLRVVRDKRGYETTYLIHSVREGSQQGARVLYAFRSPGGVRVGRDPFDPKVKREIEAGNPGIVFDWDALMSGQHLIDATSDQRRPRRRSAGDGPAPAPTPRRTEPPPPQAPRLTVPSAIEGDTPETRMRFLADWHGNLCEELPERIADPERREALMTLVQRLNPAGWIDADEIAAGLQQAAEALESLSRALAKRRRKPRRGGLREGPAAGPTTSAGVPGERPGPGPAEDPSGAGSAVIAEGDQFATSDESASDEPDQA